MPVLELRNLCVQFDTPDARVHAVNDLSFSLHAGQTLGIVGESGSGKSQGMLALMGLLAKNGHASGQALYQGRNLLTLPRAALNRIRGNRIAMVFQDAMTSLNPYLTLERQLSEVLQQHQNLTRSAARTRTLQMLEAVKIPEANQRMHLYPHEFSGGMRQRAMIAMALLCAPEILIADEPTTALDVTVQAQTMALLRALQQQLGTAIILITHDLGVIAGLCDQVLVMYGGSVMEQSSVQQLFERPSHPYTVGLLHAVPRLDSHSATLHAIPGEPPNLAQPPQGCPFAPRCALVLPQCHSTTPPLERNSAGGLRACHQSEAAVHALFSAGAAQSSQVQ
jgi:oligopeptide transport system ATP-binding protein